MAARAQGRQDREVVWGELDVAVVGGGPAGLATALALLQVQPDLKIKVFEASPEYTHQGAGVGIAVNGARALEAINPTLLHGLLHDANHLAGFFVYSDTSGERMPWVSAWSPLENLDKHGTTGGMMPWNSIRSTLYGAAPPGLVEFGCKVVGCTGRESAEAKDDELFNLVILWSTRDRCPRPAGQPPALPREVCARARFVIAADGFFSRVRRTAGDGQAPMFRRSVRWLGSIPQSDVTSGKVALPAAVQYGTNPHALTAAHNWQPTSVEAPLAAAPHRGMVLYAAGADETGGPRLVWTLFNTVEALEAAGEEYPMRRTEAAAVEAAANGSGGEAVRASVHQTSHHGLRAQERALAAGSHLPADVRALIAATQPERVMESGSYLHPPEGFVPGAWARGRLLLLGDAAHTGRPDGQGANLAIEDAAVLAACVREHGLGQQAFEAWEAARMGRVKDILHDPTPDGSLRFPLIYSGTFEPLWCPLALAQPGGPLPEDVAREVVAAVEGGGVEKGREAVLAWSRAEVRRIVEAKVAGRPELQSVQPPSGTFRMR